LTIGAKRTTEGRQASDKNTAAVNRGALVEVLVEDNGVTFNQAIITQAIMGNTGAGCVGEVTANEVVGHLVVVRTVVQGQTTAGTRQAAVLSNGVMVNRNIVVISIGVVDSVGVFTVLLLSSEQGVANSHTASEESTVVDDAVVGNGQEVCVTVQHDTATGISTGDGEAVDTRTLVSAKAGITLRLGQYKYTSTFFTKESSRFNATET